MRKILCFLVVATAIRNYRMLENAGYDSIVLSAVEIASMNEAEFKKASDLIRAGSLQCNAFNSFCVPELRLCGPHYDVDVVTAYIKALSPRASALGIDYIGIGSPKSRNVPEGYPRKKAEEELRQSFEVICRACEPYGIQVLAEAVCDLECNFITTTDEAAHFISKVDAANIGIVFDTYHAYMMGEDDKPLRRAMKHVKLVHTAQNIKGERHYLRKENMDEYRVFFNALLKAGYNGEVSVEAFYDNMELQLESTLEIMKVLSVEERN